MKRYKDTAAGSRVGGLRGMMVTSSAYKGHVWKLKWSNKTKLENIIRLTGPAAPDGKSLLPYRYSGDDNDFSGFMANYPIFAGGTTDRFTFVAAAADPNSPGDFLDFKDRPTPASIFVEAVKSMCDADPKLDAQLNPKSDIPTMPAIKTFSFAQGVLMQHGDRSYMSAPRYPSMFLLSWSAKSALEELLGTEVEGYAGDAMDYEKRFLSGDILHADTGKALSFYNALTADQAAPGAADGPNWAGGGGTAAPKKAKTELAHYACDLKMPTALPRDPDGTLTLSREGKLFTPWETATRFMSDEEMAEYIVRGYEDMPQLLLGAFRRHLDWLPNYMKDNATVVVPATSNEPALAPAAAEVPAGPPTEPATPVTPADQLNWGGGGVSQDGAPSSTPDFVQDLPEAITPEAVATQIATPLAAAPVTPAAPAVTGQPAVAPVAPAVPAAVAAAPVAAAPAPAAAPVPPAVAAALADLQGLQTPQQ